jgi:glycosyltransferase involved in cell wall biosynthesis
MRIALIAPPFIPVPPTEYGGTELFIANLATRLKQRGVDVVVYTNGASTIEVEKRWLYSDPEWPLRGDIYDNLKDIAHTSWAVKDAASDSCDIIHLNNAPGLANSRFVKIPFVYTIHHPHANDLSEFYQQFPQVQYVTISDFQKQSERLPRVRTIHHGVDATACKAIEDKEDYLAFLGRIAPIKGTHVAIEVAKKAGIPLKIAGEIQPLYQEYFDTQIKPHVDGKFIQFIGEVDLPAKNELLSKARALLFPIQWNEPFGLVMIEAMACGTPVLAFSGGSVSEIVRDGVSGWICKSADEMAAKARSIGIAPAVIREYLEETFSLDVMADRYLELYQEIVAEAEPASGGLPEEPAVA